MFLYFYSGFITGLFIGGILLLFLLKNRTKQETEKNPPIKIVSEDLEKADKLANTWENQLNEIMNYGGLTKQKYSVGTMKPPYLEENEDEK